MSDGDHTTWNGTDAQVLRRRAEIREQNATRPRCARCENELVDRSGACAISEKEEQQHGGEFVRGDLLCFWCWHAMFHEPDEAGGWQWGRA
jgi:hypothetical protein